MAEPALATISGATAGYNCRLSVRSYGSRVVRAEALSYGVEVAYTESHGPGGRVLYPLARDTPGFSLDLVFVSYADREGFSAWMSTYMRRVSTNQRIGGFVYVVVPARRFARNGVPVGPLLYGDQVGTRAYRVSVRFVGVYDPISGVGQTSVGGVSYYKAPSKDTSNAPYFYPSGTQVAGAETVEGTLYDPAPPDPAAVVEPPTRRGLAF